MNSEMGSLGTTLSIMQPSLTHPCVVWSASFTQTVSTESSGMTAIWATTTSSPLRSHTLSPRTCWVWRGCSRCSGRSPVSRKLKLAV